MSTDVISSPVRDSDLAAKTQADSLRYFVPVGRVLFAAIFLMSSLGHFSKGTIAYAASNGVPAANVLVPIAGVLALLGGISIALGYRTKLGALLIILFLIPVTFMMHNFWAVADPSMRQMQQIMFMKNLSMLGGAFVLLYFGGGPLSLDARRTAHSPTPERPVVGPTY